MVSTIYTWLCNGKKLIAYINIQKKLYKTSMYTNRSFYKQKRFFFFHNKVSTPDRLLFLTAFQVSFLKSIMIFGPNITCTVVDLLSMAFYANVVKIIKQKSRFKLEKLLSRRHRNLDERHFYSIHDSLLSIHSCYLSPN